MKRTVTWIIVNGLMLYLTYLGAFQNIVWAGRIVTFVTILFAFLYFIIAANKETLAKAREHGLSVPLLLSVIVDVALTLSFVAAGWWFLTVVSVIGSFYFYYIYGTNEVNS